jgi:hypothetical protein
MHASRFEGLPSFIDFETFKELVTKIKDHGGCENLILFGAEIKKVKDLARYARVRKQETKVSKRPWVALR